jgi:hypothetical protein
METYTIHKFRGLQQRQGPHCRRKWRSETDRRKEREKYAISRLRSGYNPQDGLETNTDRLTDRPLVLM